MGIDPKGEKTYTNSVSLAGMTTGSTSKSITYKNSVSLAGMSTGSSEPVKKQSNNVVNLSNTQKIVEKTGWDKEERDYYVNYLLQRDIAKNGNETAPTGPIWVDPSSQIIYNDNTYSVSSANNVNNTRDYGYFTSDGDPLSHKNANKQLAAINKYHYYGEKAWEGTTDYVLDPMNKAGTTVNEKAYNSVVRVMNKITGN